MIVDAASAWIFASLVLSLRIAPVFAFAPPFTLTRIPPLFRGLLGLGLAACLVSARGVQLHDLSAGALFASAARELLLGMIFVLTFQITYGAIHVAGRTMDIQAGYGLATVIDPTSHASTPLVGTLLAMLAGAVFFAANGHVELLRLFGASLEAVPIGEASIRGLGPLKDFVSLAFLIGFGVGAGVILALFLTDLAITALSRTVPQMNVLVLGFQVKALVLLIGLPISLGLSAAAASRLTRLSLDRLLTLAT